LKIYPKVKRISDSFSGRNADIKQQILALCAKYGEFSIADLSKKCGISIPTITKILGELHDAGMIEERGKFSSAGGRKPSIFGLNSEAGYFVGVDVFIGTISIAVIDFSKNIVHTQENIPFVFDGSRNSCNSISRVIRERLLEAGIELRKIRCYGFALPGRVNHVTGFSFSFFIDDHTPISKVLEEELNAPVTVENDSRAMTFGEYAAGIAEGEQHVLFMNVSWGLGMGVIIDGNILYGKSGFSGEFGHFPILDNDQICRCGKRGCLETGASGSALHRIVMEKLKEGRASSLSDKFKAGKDITLKDIFKAIENEDVLAIEAIEEVGSTLGKGLAGLINVFNPELVIIGGALAWAKDYLYMPVMGSINKYSLKLVSKDTTVKFSKLGTMTGAIGASLLAMARFFEME